MLFLLLYYQQGIAIHSNKLVVKVSATHVENSVLIVQLNQKCHRIHVFHISQEVFTHSNCFPRLPCQYIEKIANENIIHIFRNFTNNKFAWVAFCKNRFFYKTGIFFCSIVQLLGFVHHYLFLSDIQYFHSYLRHIISVVWVFLYSGVGDIAINNHTHFPYYTDNVKSVQLSLELQAISVIIDFMRFLHTLDWITFDYQGLTKVFIIKKHYFFL